MAPSSQTPRPFRRSRSYLADAAVRDRAAIESSTNDFCLAEHDNVTYDVICERLIDSEPNRPLGQLVSRETVAYSIHGLRAKREDAQMTLRGRETEERFSLVLQRRHPVAGALLGVGHDVQRQGPDVFECCPGVGVQALEVLVNDCHAVNNRQLYIVRECIKAASVACQWGMAGCPCARG